MQEPTRNDIRKRVGERTGSGSGELAELIFDELRSLAASYLRQERQGHTLQPTALVNEAYLRLLDSSTELPASREGFLRLAAHIMRHVLVDYARARLAEKRGSGKRTHLTLDRALAPSGFEIVDLLSLDEAMTRLAAEKPRMAEVVELRFFGGMTIPEVAVSIGVSESTVDNDWYVAKAWLARELGGAEAEGGSG